MQVSEEEQKTHQGEVVNLCNGPQVYPHMSDMLIRFTLTLFAVFAFLPHFFWRYLAFISYLSFWGIKKKVLFWFCWKLTIWFSHSEKHHQRAVHLCPSAGWCQDWRWPKSHRTESSSERSGCALFSLPVPLWHLPAEGNLRDPFEGARAPSIEDLAHQIPITLTGQVGEEAARTPSKHL